MGIEISKYGGARGNSKPLERAEDLRGTPFQAARGEVEAWVVKLRNPLLSGISRRRKGGKDINPVVGMSPKLFGQWRAPSSKLRKGQ